MVQIDAPCLDCGLPMRVQVRDGQILNTDPKGLMGYVAVPFWRWAENISYA
jgi:hypothetical protein